MMSDSKNGEDLVSSVSSELPYRRTLPGLCGMTLDLVFSDCQVLTVNAQIMAGHSRYFEAVIASKMAEAHDGKILLQDVDREHFEHAMRYLEDFSVSLADDVDKTKKQAMCENVARIYDRFDMPMGLKILDGSVKKILLTSSTKNNQSKTNEREIDQWITYTRLANQANLHEALNAGLKLLEKVLKPTHQPFDLTEKHVERCKPLIVAYPEDLLPDGFSVEQAEESLFAPHLILKYKAELPENMNQPTSFTYPTSRGNRISREEAHRRAAAWARQEAARERGNGRRQDAWWMQDIYVERNEGEIS